MDMDIVIGIILTAVALSLVIGITLLSRARIERMAANGYRTARQTLKDKRHVK